jgi:hypothetical protein
LDNEDYGDETEDDEMTPDTQPSNFEASQSLNDNKLAVHDEDAKAEMDPSMADWFKVEAEPKEKEEDEESVTEDEEEPESDNDDTKLEDEDADWEDLKGLDIMSEADGKSEVAPSNTTASVL